MASTYRTRHDMRCSKIRMSVHPLVSGPWRKRAAEEEDREPVANRGAKAWRRRRRAKRPQNILIHVAVLGEDGGEDDLRFVYLSAMFLDGCHRI